MTAMSIPDHWTPEQAHAVIETLEALAEQFWSTYGDAIAREFYAPPEPCDLVRQLELPLTCRPFADEIPF